MEELNTTVQTWLDEIADAKKREKDFRDDGKNILDIFNIKNKEKVPFNILFSNTETLLPAVFSNTPRPIVKKRFHTEDSPLVKAGAKAATNLLSYLVDTNVDGYPSFDRSMKSVVLDSLLPGRGTAQIKYDATMEGEGDDESVKYETICMSPRKWDRMYHGYALTWEDVPWVAYEDFIDKAEAEELFDAEIVAKIDFTEGQETEDDEKPDEVKHIGKRKTAQIYQIWDKSDKKIKYISPQYKDGYLKEMDDEFGITGFYNCPRPLQFIEKSNDLIPVALFREYENQAEELNHIQGRLNRVIKAIKARGAYNGILGNTLEKVMDEDDNGLIASDEAQALQNGFKDNIWFLPIGELIAVAQQLIMARESAKQVIYEITGISDIVRGQSKASETLGAQQIKAQWGSMRVKDKQKAVQQYARDSLRIMLDIAVNKFSIKTWAEITGLPYPFEEKRQQARQQIQAMKMQHDQKIAAIADQIPPGQNPPPPPPFQPDPQLLRIAQSPTWEEILELLKNDYIRSYKVDIETNSTLEAEATEDKQLVAEFMNAMAQFLNGVAPMMEKGIMTMDVVKSMLLEISSRFRFGEDVEEQIKGMQSPKPQADPKMQEMGKKLQEAKKSMDKERQKLEEDKKRANDELTKQARQLEMDKMEFNYQKKLASEQLKMEKKLSDMQLNSDKTLANEQVKSLIKDNERKLQSMLDKHMNAVKSMTQPG